MIKRDVTQLAVYRIEKEEETLPLERLKNLYLEYRSEIIYVIKDKKLYGIICLGDVMYHTCEGKVTINKNFTVLVGYNVIKAHEIFRSKRNIHKLPVVNEEKELIGDYSRWDDMLSIRRNQAYLMQADAVKRVLEPYGKVYIIETVENENDAYEYLFIQLKKLCIEFTVLNMAQIGDRLADNSIFLFFSQDERRAMLCLYYKECLILEKGGGEVKTIDYKGLLYQIMKEAQFRRLKIKKPTDIPYGMINDKETVLFSAFREKGIRCFGVYSDEYELTEYGEKFKNEVKGRLQADPLMADEPWPKRLNREEFYNGLLENEDYAKDIAQREIYHASSVVELRKNITGKYFNAKKGRRVTCFQPKEYVGTIYVLGPCTVLGVFVEDQYTIPSLLQRVLLEAGYPYRVENLGAVMRRDAEFDTRLQEVDQYCTNDIIVAISQRGENIQNGMSLEKIFEKNSIPSGWVTDGYLHCNHKANKLVADSILELIEHCLLNRLTKTNSNMQVKVNLHDTMKAYIQHKYLEQYFSDFCAGKYCTVGAIVMNCNPFSKGHRYLIEQAKKQVEFLIVFVVEENRSLFPFEERFKMVKDGTKDFSDIMVVPSGEFVLSYNNFHEYFNKNSEEATFLNAEYDIDIFVNFIAKPLHITHRFAGEEPEDITTDIYNKAMKKILPKAGITFVEIPRITMEGEVVSASRIRKYLEEREYDKAFALLPETTQEHLLKQI